MQIYNKNKELTNYGLSCGYVEKKNTNSAKVQLYKEFDIYHVRRHSVFIDGRLIQEAWFCFDNLVDARRAYRRQCDLAGIK